MNMPSHATNAERYRIRLYPNRSPILPKTNAAALRHFDQLRPRWPVLGPLTKALIVPTTLMYAELASGNATLE